MREALLAGAAVRGCCGYPAVFPSDLRFFDSSTSPWAVQPDMGRRLKSAGIRHSGRAKEGIESVRYLRAGRRGAGYETACNRYTPCPRVSVSISFRALRTLRSPTTR